jgi:chemotaxis protein methyltransferase CheR
MSQEIKDKELNIFIDRVKNLSNYNFSDYSDKSLKRRLAKILFDNGLDFQSFLDRIEKSKSFLEKIVRDITVSTTELFRDPPVWNALRYEIIPLFKDLEQLNIWHAGCSTGQEVYSMLILLNELNLFNKSNLYATDINPDVLEISKTGTYKYRFNLNYLDNFDSVIRQNQAGEYQDVAYSNYFSIDKTRDIIKMNTFLTDKPVYKKMDLVWESNPFPVQYHLIICRNVIIYFNYALQNKVFKLFHESLQTGGCLVLGAHETILGPLASLFTKKSHGYFKK